MELNSFWKLGLISKNFLMFFLVLVFFGCKEIDVVRDNPLSILSSETTLLNVGNLRYQNAKFHISDQGNFLIIHQDRKLWWFDLNKDLITRSVDLDTTNLVLPEVSILQARYQENDSSLVLFFPQRSKIIHLNSSFQIDKEIDLSGLQNIDHMFMGYGDAFFYDPDEKEYYIGIISAKSNDHKAFLNEMKFVGIFDEKTGKLKNTFGNFGEKRKALEAMVLSEGIFHIDFKNDRFLLREVIADQTIHRYSKDGKKLDSFNLGTSEIESKIFAFESGDDFFSSPRSDQFYSMKVTESGLVVSNTFSTETINDELKYFSYLLIEDPEKKVSYSTPIGAFQKIVKANDTGIHMVRNHPKTEDLILVKVKYELGEVN
ncbi:hypothetical protein JYB64_15405 [Algoriphagus aestuarii]|nr:hypothetical protein [Algoriphagus aestuarii]